MAGARREQGSDGWFRIIKDAGPELTWEWLMVDSSRPYAPLFTAELRQRVRQALEAHAGYAAWTEERLAALEPQHAEQVSRDVADYLQANPSLAEALGASEPPEGEKSLSA